MILGIGLKTSVEFWNDIGEMELVDEVKRWDIFLVVFRSVIDSWGRGRWGRDLFDERHSGSGCWSRGFLVEPLKRGCAGFYRLPGFVWCCLGFAPVPKCCHR